MSMPTRGISRLILCMRCWNLTPCSESFQQLLVYSMQIFWWLCIQMMASLLRAAAHVLLTGSRVHGGTCLYISLYSVLLHLLCMLEPWIGQRFLQSVQWCVIFACLPVQRRHGRCGKPAAARHPEQIWDCELAKQFATGTPLDCHAPRCETPMVYSSCFSSRASSAGQMMEMIRPLDHQASRMGHVPSTCWCSSMLEPHPSFLGHVKYLAFLP